MKTEDRVLLNDIKAYTDRWTILVRVFRRWNMYQKSDPNEVAVICLLLVDEEGTRIQATVSTRALKRFNDTAFESKVYLMSIFSVSANRSPYRATTHPLKIELSTHTKVEEVDADLPFHAYEFFDLPNLLEIKDKKEVEYLIDVMAFVKSIGKIEPYWKDEVEKKKLRLVITDNKGNDVECVLWDECSSEAYSDYIMNESTPVVVLFNLARVGFSIDGVPQVHNSYNATRVLFNPEIKEVSDYISKNWNVSGSTFAVTEMSQPLPTQYSQQQSASALLKERRIEISEMPQQKLGEYFAVMCEIQKFETIHGWNYDGCAKCAAMVKGDIDEFICPICKKKPEAIEPKLRLHYVVTDTSGSASVMFWDRVAIQLIHKTASQLKFLVKEEDDESDILDILESVVSKRLLIKMRRNEYNKKFPNSSVSVTQFVMCEDLGPQFEEADIDSAPGGSGSSGCLYKTRKSVKTELMKKADDSGKEDEQPSKQTSATPHITMLDDDEDEDDDMPLAKLSRTSRRQDGKGKNVATDFSGSHKKSSAGGSEISGKMKPSRRNVKNIKLD